MLVYVIFMLYSNRQNVNSKLFIKKNVLRLIYVKNLYNINVVFFGNGNKNFNFK